MQEKRFFKCTLAHSKCVIPLKKPRDSSSSSFFSSEGLNVVAVGLSCIVGDSYLRIASKARGYCSSTYSINIFSFVCTYVCVCLYCIVCGCVCVWMFGAYFFFLLLPLLFSLLLLRIRAQKTNAAKTS